MTKPQLDMNDILLLCRKLSSARERLSEVTEAVRNEQRQAVRRRLRGLKARVAEVSAARDELEAAVSASPELFEKPRTRAMEGVKVGYRKMPGRIECNPERTIERIRKIFPNREQELVKTTRSLKKPALRALTSRELRAIGVSIISVDDEVVIAVAGDDLDKLVSALMADGEDGE